MLKAQHPSAQSASDVQGPVMNWVPGVMVEVGGAAATATEVAAGGGASPCAINALLLGEASPKPHPPSTPGSEATRGAAQSPVLKAQHPSAQSASDVQGPVMN